MLSYLLNSLKKIDRFGAIFRPAFVDLNPEYRSCIGGLATLLIYGLSFAYFCYQIAQWQSNQLLPKITVTQTSYNYKEYFASDNISSFYIRRSSVSKQIDPFDPTNLILQPIIYVFKNTQLNYSKSFSFNMRSERYNNTEIFLDNLEFILNTENTFENSQIDYFLTFGPCLDKYLQADQKCANQSVVDAFMTQSTNIIVVNQYVKEYNTKQKRLVSVPRESFTFFSNDSTFYSQNQIKLGETFVDQGILFESNRRFEFTSDVQIITQQLSLSQFSKSLGRPTYLAYHYRLGQIMQTQFIEYPKISEVLADIGSITSLILVLSCFFTFMNEYQLEQQSIKKVIEMYYPEATKIKFTKNWYGKIMNVYLNESQINTCEFLNYYDKLRKIATTKLSLSNILYTLSRIQFVIQSNYNIDEIKLAHSIGIKLKHFNKVGQQISHDQSQSNLQVIEVEDSKIHCQEPDIQNENLNTISNQKQETQVKVSQEALFIKSIQKHHFLSDDDFFLFTIGEDHLIDPEILNQYEYYQQNYIEI